MSAVFISMKAGNCPKCGGPRDSTQHYCRACFAAYARARRTTLAKEGKRCWTNTRADRMRTNGHAFICPSWLAPKNVPQMISTISASIVWGICGKMADTPEY